MNQASHTFGKYEILEKIGEVYKARDRDSESLTR